MGDLNTARVSALAGHYSKGHHGVQGAGVVMQEVPDLVLWQLAAWPESLSTAAGKLAQSTGVGNVPEFGAAAGDEKISLLRTEPLKFWAYGAAVETSSAEESVVLDISHSRTQIRISGPQATTVLNSYLPIDLRENSFPQNSVASTAFHHVGVTLWRSPAGYELFLPRGFALSLWELLQESALQYGLMIE